MQTREHMSCLRGKPVVAPRVQKPSVPDFSRAVRLFNAEILIFNRWELILDKYNVTVQAK